MKKRFTSIIIVIAMIATLVTGCGGKEKEQKETPKEEVTTEAVQEEDATSENNENDETSSEESKEEESSFSVVDQATTYLEYKEEFGEDMLNVEPIGENGNTYDFNTDNLGYYTNGIVGFYFYQVNGEYLRCDIFFYDYYFGYYDAVDVIDADTITFVYDQIMSQENSEQMMVNGFMTDALEGTITFNDGSFEITDTYCLRDVFGMCLLQDVWNYFNAVKLGPDDTIDRELTTLAFGKYTKQDEETIKNLKMINQYQLYDNGSGEPMKYQNNQPVGDRLTKEKFPKYVSAIPENEWYIYGDPDNLESGEPFVLVQVLTAGNTDLTQSATTSIEVKIHTLVQNTQYSTSLDSDLDYWYNSTNYDYVFTNFNYNIPEYEAVVDREELDTIIGSSTELETEYDSTKNHLRLKLTCNEDGTITLTGTPVEALSSFYINDNEDVNGSVNINISGEALMLLIS